MATSARSGKYQPVGFQQITSLSAAVRLTVPAAGDGKANVAILNPEAQSVRWRDDGTDPTASVGIVIAAGATFVYEGDLNTLKVIETTASAKLNVTFHSNNRGA